MHFSVYVWGFFALAQWHGGREQLWQKGQTSFDGILACR
jgi:hypothetical protein